MPYIPLEERTPIDIGTGDLAPYVSGPGKLNYTITKLIQEIYGRDEWSYRTYNEIIGVLECVKQEFYRRAVAPYEDQKAKENGDVY